MLTLMATGQCILFSVVTNDGLIMDITHCVQIVQGGKGSILHK